jgi:hypothetical protein
VSQHSDAPIDSDPLTEFTIEPQAPQQDAQAAASADVAATQPRVDRLEQAVERSISDLLLLRAEVATLVGAIDDIRSDNRRGVAHSRRSNLPSAVAGMLAGMAIAVLGWMTWSSGPIDTAAAASVPATAVESPVESETPAPAPAIALASVDSAQTATRDVPVRAASRVAPVDIERAAPVDIEYVGTLSIDATPAGAQVFVNRRAAGSVPLRLEKLKAGSHLVWIQRDGYRRWTQVVQVRSDRVSRVSAALEPIAAP